MTRKKAIMTAVALALAVLIDTMILRYHRVAGGGSIWTLQNVIRVALCAAVDLFLFYLWKRQDEILEIPTEVLESRKLVFSLARNDFKSRFAGSYLGIVWAFVQPIVTVVVYWFVFEKALNAGTQSTKAGITVPYVLWLIAGLVPWFYFQDVVLSGTNALLEYSYLVKKMVFNISTLPVVKAVSSLFVHLFFIGFTIVMYLLYGHVPDLYTLQIVYYSFCMFVLALGIIYATSAMVVFFRDLSQIVSIILQVLIWATPIMWNIDGMTLSRPLSIILKLNPMYYIVCGYRDSLISKIWFFERPELTLYYWTVTLLLFLFGTMIFRRLKVHFADVL